MIKQTQQQQHMRVNKRYEIRRIASTSCLYLQNKHGSVHIQAVLLYA
ncbi:hypothetical protein R4Z10_09975 [Niallia sp. XMNu-256]